MLRTEAFEVSIVLLFLAEKLGEGVFRVREGTISLFVGSRHDASMLGTTGQTRSPWVSKSHPGGLTYTYTISFNFASALLHARLAVSAFVNFMISAISS